eukprot:GHVU01101762.1.p2 GENE.GHVU01101762.1~~GHVU01101762.1.p2  ORF type:complete len:108 (+),score=13.56 GHVU01101762.1:722-1045(+)
MTMMGMTSRVRVLLILRRSRLAGRHQAAARRLAAAHVVAREDGPTGALSGTSSTGPVVTRLKARNKARKGGRKEEQRGGKADGRKKSIGRGGGQRCCTYLFLQVMLA